MRRSVVGAHRAPSSLLNVPNSIFLPVSTSRMRISPVIVLATDIVEVSEPAPVRGPAGTVHLCILRDQLHPPVWPFQIQFIAHVFKMFRLPPTKGGTDDRSGNRSMRRLRLVAAVQGV